MAAAAARQVALTKPAGSLGRLEQIGIQVAGIQGRSRPELARKAVFVLAADHGCVVEGTSAYPQEVTAQMLANFARGGAAINVLARQVGARVIVVDMGVAGPCPALARVLRRAIGPGTRNLAAGPAMSRAEAQQGVEVGMVLCEAQADEGLDLVATGDMGIGNTTSSAALVAAFTGRSPADVTGRGTGVDDAGLERKVTVITRALEVNRPDPADPLGVLAKLGGFEIAGLVGVMLAAGARRLPVVLDGLISGAAALVAVGLAPGLRPYLIAGHRSAEPGHSAALAHLGIQPLLDLGLRLGEGTGAALAIPLVEAAVRTLNEMATFAEAGISGAVGEGCGAY